VRPLREYFTPATAPEYDGTSDEKARRLRELMERQWSYPGVINPRRRNRFVMPINLGGTRGYYDDICPE
jgi:hypothetical protein